MEWFEVWKKSFKITSNNSNSFADGNFMKDERVIAFGSGKRICLGQSLAEKELFVFLTGLCQQVSISSTFTASFFCVKVFWAAFMRWQLVFVIFWQKEIRAKAARKMLVKLTTGVATFHQHLRAAFCTNFLTLFCCVQNLCQIMVTDTKVLTKVK